MTEFRTSFENLETGVRMAFIHEGRGGSPLVLLHGFPQTKRIWVRNIAALAAAGFEVIAPDLRGYGESSFAPDGYYDPAAFGEDIRQLLNALGHRTCILAGGDLGGAVAIDLALRHPGIARAMCVFNAASPRLPEQFSAAGIPEDSWNDGWDYAIEQGTAADRLVDELNTPELRMRYIAGFYGHRLWGTPGGFASADVQFMVEPFADRDRLRVSFVDYEVFMGKKEPSAPELLDRPVDVPALVLYGPDDSIATRSYVAKAQVAFTSCIGPFVVPRSGHYMPWEQPQSFNDAIRCLLHQGS